ARARRHENRSERAFAHSEADLVFSDAVWAAGGLHREELHGLPLDLSFRRSVGLCTADDEECAVRVASDGGGWLGGLAHDRNLAFRPSPGMRLLARESGLPAGEDRPPLGPQTRGR